MKVKSCPLTKFEEGIEGKKKSALIFAGNDKTFNL